MSRYLNHSQISFALFHGKSVEQLLISLRYTSTGICWLELRPSNKGVELWSYQVIDEGHANDIEVYSFSPVYPERVHSPYSIHDSLENAMHQAELTFRADETRWINQFSLQEEYSDLILQKQK